MKILVVDDSEPMRNVLIMLLKQLFDTIEIDEAVHGIAAIERHKSADYDVTFMDVSMPEMNGVEATKRILSEFPDRKIIAFSMNDDKEKITAMFSAGAKQYLLKTDPVEKIYETVCLLVKT